jgi:hypothetical protein
VQVAEVSRMVINAVIVCFISIMSNGWLWGWLERSVSQSLAAVCCHLLSIPCSWREWQIAGLNVAAFRLGGHGDRCRQEAGRRHMYFAPREGHIPPRKGRQAYGTDHIGTMPSVDGAKSECPIAVRTTLLFRLSAICHDGLRNRAAIDFTDYRAPDTVGVQSPMRNREHASAAAESKGDRYDICLRHHVPTPESAAQDRAACTQAVRCCVSSTQMICVVFLPGNNVAPNYAAAAGGTRMSTGGGLPTTVLG